MKLRSMLLLVMFAFVMGCSEDDSSGQSDNGYSLIPGFNSTLAVAGAVKPTPPTPPTKPTIAKPTKPGEKPVTTKPTKPGEKPVTTKPSSGYSHSSTYTSYGTRNGGRQAWRIPKKGPEFGSKIKVVFSDGHTVIDNNTSKNYREGDGFVFKPGIGPNGEGSADTGTAHGGVYLHAPYGNRSKQVTFYY